MTTNGTNTIEDTEMGECDGDKVVTMLDVLQEEQEFEEDANAVLGASDDKNCSYNKGYIKRQAIYACMTCCYDAKIEPSKRAGVCLACSLTCHENHELIELYTKRNFRCDCGNAKFNSHPCQFNPNKTDLNEDNKYNQNYSGLYCTCHRPYPDPESTTEDEMIQCIICEDWLHASHLDAVVPDEPYSEMICKDCMERNNFLHDYSSIAITTENLDVDIVSDANTKSNNITESVDTIDKTKEPDFEMKNDADINLIDQKNTEAGPQTENKNESKCSSENDSINKETNEVRQEENDDVTNDTNLNTTPDILLKEEKSDDNGTLVIQTVEVQLSEDKINNIVSENITLSAVEDKIECETNLPDNKESSVNDESIADSVQNDNAVENECFTQDTDKTTTSEPVNSRDDIPLTDNNGSENITDVDQNIPKIEEDLISNPTNAQEPTDEQQEEMPTEITKSNIVSDNEPMKDNTEDKTAIETCTDGKEEIDMDIVEKKEESDINNTAVQNTEPENCLTINEQNNQAESINKLQEDFSDTNKNEHQESKDTTEDDSKENEKRSTKDEETNSHTSHSYKESNTENLNENVTNSNNENKRKLSMETDGDDGAKRVKPNETKDCTRPKGIKTHLKGATFWPSNFRQKLCTCTECLSMYKHLAVLFLIDSEDTVAAYETLGKERSNGNSQYEKGLQALSSLDRIQQINAVTEYNKLREKLSDFLKSFMLKKEIVKEEDIKAFFAGMKPKREPDGVYFCR